MLLGDKLPTGNSSKVIIPDIMQLDRVSVPCYRSRLGAGGNWTLGIIVEGCGQGSKPSLGVSSIKVGLALVDEESDDILVTTRLFIIKYIHVPSFGLIS